MITTQLIVVCISLASCLAFPSSKKIADTNLSETVKHTVKDINKRGTYKREMSDLEATIQAFYLTDMNGNGSISPQEWALFYSTIDAEGLPDLSYNGWLYAFELQITEHGFDRNSNGQMELGEYLMI